MEVSADMLSKANAWMPVAEQGLELGKDLFSNYLRDKMIKPARNRYLETLGKNAGYSGYSRAQTDSMRRARDLARQEIAEAQGQAMASNASIGQRINAMTQVGANANNKDFYDLNTSLQNAENTGRQNQVGIAEGNAGRAKESFDRATNILGDAGKNLLNYASANAAMHAGSSSGDYSTPTMEPTKGKANTSAAVQVSAFDDAMRDRIRGGTASDSDMETAFKAGYKGGPKTQDYYRSKGWL